MNKEIIETIQLTLSSLKRDPIVCARIFSIIFLFYKFLKKDRMFRVDFQAIINFTVFMIMVTLVRLIVLVNFPITVPAGLEQVSNIGILFVFWEDLFFAYPIIIVENYINNKYLRNLLIFAISFMFMMGHTYQGLRGLITIVIPYFVMAKVGKKYGLGTSMVGHVMYDLFTVLTVIFALALLP